MFRMLNLVLNILKYFSILTLARLLTTALNLEFGVSRQYLRLLEWLLQLGERRIERCESEHRLLQELAASQGLVETFASTNSLEDACPCAPEPPRARPNGLVAQEPQPLGLRLLSEPRSLAARFIRRPSELAIERNPLDESSASKLPEAASARPAERKRRVGIALQTTIINGQVEGGNKNNANYINKLLAHNTTFGQVCQLQQQQQKRRRVSTPDGPPIFLLDDDDDDDDDDEAAAAAAAAATSERGNGAAYNGNDENSLANLIRANFKRAQHEDGQKCPPAPVQCPLRKKHEFQLKDPAKLVVRGISAIIDDEVLKRFTREELKCWNLLTRTNAKNYQFMSRSLGLCWLTGLLIRYAMLMPLRIMFTLTGFIWLLITMPLIGLLPKQFRDRPCRLSSLMAFRMLSCGITSRLQFHNRQFRARKGDICVANHTSPLDVVLLACDNCYSLVGQRHGGLLGVLQATLSRAMQHVWFDRSEMRDRQLVSERLKAHIKTKSNLPVLIFPEGTCINNSAVMMFRKGSFEVTDIICPVAIKYDARFGDPFWNSSEQGYVRYLLMLMSSWAIKCDVWYLPPMERLQSESSAEFANRVKAEIAKQGGLEDLAWDGQLKRSSVKPAWLYQQQEDYARRLKLD